MIACQMLKTFFDRLRPAVAVAAPLTEAQPATRVLVCRTHDEVNADLARSWCDDNGIDFRLAGRRDPLFPEDAAALVLDVNHLGLDAGERTQFVERLCQLLPPYPVAVVSYDLAWEVKKLLRARGWLIFRHVKRQIFYELAAVRGDDCRRNSARGKIPRIMSGKMLQYR